MKFRTFILLAAAMLGSHALRAQSVTTSPAMVTASSTNITVTFHADGGNRGLADLDKESAIYAHTGVITSKSESATDWKYATSWSQNLEKYKLTYVSLNTWQLVIPDIREFYGITDPAETVEKLCFVFRNADGTREGKTGTGGDIYVQIFPDGFPASAEASLPASGTKMGANVGADGSVTFCMVAPGRSNVVMMGSWDDFALSSSNVMSYTDVDGLRYFHLTLPASTIQPGKDYTYYYMVDGSTFVGDPYAHLVLDPYNDQYISSSVFPDLPAYPVKSISGVPLAIFNTTLDDYAFEVTDFTGVPQSDLILYEVLIRDFTGTEGQAYGSGTVKGLIDKLDYIQELGVNAIELLPIMEFAGNNSWGYNTSFYMAPDKAYGTPADYKRLVDEAHKRGLAVVLDIVFNQSDGLHPWFDLTRRDISKFYNGSAPHAYSVLNDWSQDCDLVQQQWYDALTYWTQVYKVDGFRFDLVKGLGDNDSYSNTYYPDTNTWGNPSSTDTDRYNASRIARMKKLHEHLSAVNPAAYFINEDLAGAEEENALAADGDANWANANYAATQYVMGTANGILSRFYAPHDNNRLWGSTVSYAESHDEPRVAYSPYSDINSVTRGSLANVLLRTGSMAAQMLMAPGAHMIWQFEELGSRLNYTGDNRTSPQKVEWNNLNKTVNKGLHDTFMQLCNIRKEYPAMFAQDAAQTVELSSNTARYICLAKGDAELYLVVNSACQAPSVSSTVPFPKNPSTNATVDLNDSRFTLLSASYNTTPQLTTTGVTLPAGTYAVYGANLESGIEDIFADTPAGGSRLVNVGGRVITPAVPCTSFAVYAVSGCLVDASQPLAPGVYVATVDGRSVKVAVR